MAGLRPGPDLEEALTSTDDRRAIGIKPDGGEPVLSIPKSAITTARTLVFALKADQQDIVRSAAAAGKKADNIVGRILAEVKVPIDAHVMPAKE